MARPVKKRTTKTYRRDVEHLTRLRTAVLMDNQLEKALSARVVREIDKLTDTILEILKQEASGTAA